MYNMYIIPLASSLFAPTWEVAGMLDRNIVWTCRLLDICFHNRPVARMVPQFTLWTECGQVVAAQIWPPAKSRKHRARGRGIGGRGGAGGRGRAVGRGRGRARGGGRLPAAAPGGYAEAPGAVVAGWLEAGDMSEEYSVDGSDEDGDACDVSTVSDEPDVDGADESEMAEAL